MSRKELEALGYVFVESDLPAIVREWCVGDSVLCLVRGECDYFENEVRKRLKPFPIEREMAGYWIFAGLVVLEPSESDTVRNETRQVAAARGHVQCADKATLGRSARYGLFSCGYPFLRVTDRKVEA